MNSIKAGISLAVALLVLAAGYWGWGEWRERQSEKRAVAEAEAKRQAAIVASLEQQLASARTEASRVDTVIRTVLSRPAPQRPVTPPDTILVSLGTDSLMTLVTVLEAYSDTVAKENMLLRSTLDTAQRVLAGYRLLADSTIAAQGRQIDAMQIVIDTPKPRRRWGLGGACGYAVIARAADCTIGLSFSF